MTNIYIVSSITGLHRCNGIVGVVIEPEGREARTQFGIVTDATANQSVLLGIKFALSRINPECDVVIHTDNQYVANAVENGWVRDWIANNWHNSKGKEVANRAEWEQIMTRLGSRIPKFVVGEEHSYKSWLISEVQKRAKAHKH